jgi:hypothetical protein
VEETAQRFKAPEWTRVARMVSDCGSAAPSLILEYKKPRFEASHSVTVFFSDANNKKASTITAGLFNN